MYIVWNCSHWRMSFECIRSAFHRAGLSTRQQYHASDCAVFRTTQLVWLPVSNKTLLVREFHICLSCAISSYWCAGVYTTSVCRTVWKHAWCTCRCSLQYWWVWRRHCRQCGSCYTTRCELTGNSVKLLVCIALLIVSDSLCKLYNFHTKDGSDYRKMWTS